MIIFPLDFDILVPSVPGTSLVSSLILTSGTTLFISITMLIFGGLAIKSFFVAITLGVFVGTYSSIFVAAPVTLLVAKFQNR